MIQLHAVLWSYLGPSMELETAVRLHQFHCAALTGPPATLPAGHLPGPLP